MAFCCLCFGISEFGPERVGPVNNFFNTGRVNGQICTIQVTSLESWILSEGRPAMGISFPLIPLIFSNAGFLWVLSLPLFWAGD